MRWIYYSRNFNKLYICDWYIQFSYVSLFVGGFFGTYNVTARNLLDVSISGTHAHSFAVSFTSLDEVKGLTINKKGVDSLVELLLLVLQYCEKNDVTNTNDSELEAFISYDIAFPDGLICLIDTYNTIESGVMNFIFWDKSYYNIIHNFFKSEQY